MNSSSEDATKNSPNLSEIVWRKLRQAAMAGLINPDDAGVGAWVRALQHAPIDLLEQAFDKAIRETTTGLKPGHVWRVCHELMEEVATPRGETMYDCEICGGCGWKIVPDQSHAGFNLAVPCQCRATKALPVGQIYDRRREREERITFQEFREIFRQASEVSSSFQEALAEIENAERTARREEKSRYAKMPTATLRRHLKTAEWLREFVLACPSSIPEDRQAKLWARIQLFQQELAKREMSDDATA